MSTSEQRLAGQTARIWTHRFWTHVKERTGLSIHRVLNVVRFSDIEQRIQAFESDPESAAEEQLAKWRTKYHMIDKALRTKSIDGSREMKHGIEKSVISPTMLPGEEDVATRSI